MPRPIKPLPRPTAATDLPDIGSQNDSSAATGPSPQEVPAPSARQPSASASQSQPRRAAAENEDDATSEAAAKHSRRPQPDEGSLAWTPQPSRPLRTGRQQWSEEERAAFGAMRALAAASDELAAAVERVMNANVLHEADQVALQGHAALVSACLVPLEAGPPSFAVTSGMCRSQQKALRALSQLLADNLTDQPFSSATLYAWQGLAHLLTEARPAQPLATLRPLRLAIS